MILAVFGVLFTVALGFFLWRAMTTPYKNFDEPQVRVEVKKGLHSGAILEHLRTAGVLRDDFVPLIYLKTIRRGDSLKAGVYEFSGAASPVAVLEKLIEGDVVLHSVTIREGLDRFQIAAIMAAEGFGSEDEWRDLTDDAELVRDLDPEATSLEGYLFPDTYTLAPGTRPAAIVRTMVQNFRKQFGGELAFIETGLDLHETVTLASIVETEARLEHERPIVASVYLNRTRIRMPLQADPTVIYAMKLNDTWKGNIRKEDLKLDSPYNTYVKRGFPPGPIANPGLASLRAASAPAKTDFLYFVSRNDGSHVFSRTLAEHNRAVQTYQRDYWRERREREQKAAQTP
ncbi:MAG TPA: endolytic transglycosylase MltG [Thermoanaerobaculia bacterium]|nr:endolytic transglycosylase MltG [Thermoanaerobaculia bacterium]